MRGFGLWPVFADEHFGPTGFACVDVEKFRSGSADPVANLARSFYGAHNFAGEDVEFIGGGFLDEEGTAVFGGIIFHHAHGEARAEVAGVFRGRDGEG